MHLFSELHPPAWKREIVTVTGAGKVDTLAATAASAAAVISN